MDECKVELKYLSKGEKLLPGGGTLESHGQWHFTSYALRSCFARSIIPAFHLMEVHWPKSLFTSQGGPGWVKYALKAFPKHPGKYERLRQKAAFKYGYQHVESRLNNA